MAAGGVREPERDMISGLSDDQWDFVTSCVALTGCAGPRPRPPAFSFGPIGIGSLYQFIHCYLSADPGVSYVKYPFILACISPAFVGLPRLQQGAGSLSLWGASNASSGIWQRLCQAIQTARHRLEESAQSRYMSDGT